MGQDSLIPVATNARSRNDLVERGFSRQPLRVDVDIARTLEALSHAAWSIPRDKYYDGGDRYRSLNRLRAEIVEGGVRVWSTDESAPYVQLEKYNTTLGDQQREYAPLPPAIAGKVSGSPTPAKAKPQDCVQLPPDEFQSIASGKKSFVG